MNCVNASAVRGFAARSYLLEVKFWELVIAYELELLHHLSDVVFDETLRAHVTFRMQFHATDATEIAQQSGAQHLHKADNVALGPHSDILDADARILRTFAASSRIFKSWPSMST